MKLGHYVVWFGHKGYPLTLIGKISGQTDTNPLSPKQTNKRRVARCIINWCMGLSGNFALTFNTVVLASWRKGLSHDINMYWPSRKPFWVKHTSNNKRTQLRMFFVAASIVVDFESSWYRVDIFSLVSSFSKKAIDTLELKLTSEYALLSF